MTHNVDDVGHAVDLVIETARTKKLEPSISTISTCLRMAYYKTFTPVPTNAKMIEGIEKHAFFERYLKQAMEQLGYRCEAEAEVTYGPIHGRADLTCQNQDKRYVIELKFTSNPSPSNLFHHFWIRQLKYYVALLTLRTGHRWTGYLIASDFDLATRYTEQVEVDDPHSVYREAEDRYNALVTALTKGRKPPRERGQWCNACGYKAKCLNYTFYNDVNTLEANAEA